VLANDSDPDSDPLTVTSVAAPSHGTISNWSNIGPGNGSMTYTPVLGFKGKDTFTYSISDGRGGSATATVTVTVR
jgi:hypothetical protein